MGSSTTPRWPLCLCLTPDTNSLSSWQMPHVHLAQALWKAPQDKNLTHVGAHQTLKGLGPSLFPGSSRVWAPAVVLKTPVLWMSSPPSSTLLLCPQFLSRKPSSQEQFQCSPSGLPQHLQSTEIRLLKLFECIPISLVNCLSLYSQHCQIHDSCLINVWGTIIFIYWSKLFT